MEDLISIEHYGNGFKSGSMRIGKDALVFTKFSQVCLLSILPNHRLLTPITLRHS